MLFNSNQFFILFALFCGAYFLVRRNLTARNALVVVASYVFYGWWDWRFTALLFFTSGLDFILARGIDGAREERRRRALLVTSVVCNLGVLTLFKYFNFFRESFESLLNTWGVESHWKGWQVVLPVGISFYTFQSMSYVIDVYRRQMPACRNPVQFMAYVSFFPQLVAGPIERGGHMLPQFGRALRITAADLELGVWLVVWGMFKKVALADNLAPLVDLVYGHPASSGLMVVLGTMAFGLQVYCDFSGYSDIARGLARLLGFELMINFNLPYFATSLRDFWTRWHISLSRWLRDYLYIPLGGSRRGEARTYLNLAITMLLCGLWHGAALSFVLWGAWHGAGLMVNRWWDRHRRGFLPDWLGWLATGLFVLYGWMLFRADSLGQIIQLTAALGNFSPPHWWPHYAGSLAALALPLASMEIWQWRRQRAGATPSPGGWPRAVLQGAMIMIILAYWQGDTAPFIYFQF